MRGEGFDIWLANPILEGVCGVVLRSNSVYKCARPQPEAIFTWIFQDGGRLDL